MFDLNVAIRDWRDELHGRGSFLHDDLVELELHLREQIDDLEQTGLNANESFLVAVNRMGTGGELGREFEKVKPWATWRAPVFWLVLGAFLGLMGEQLWYALIVGTIGFGAMIGVSAGALHWLVAGVAIVGPVLAVMGAERLTRRPLNPRFSRGLLFGFGSACLVAFFVGQAAPYVVMPVVVDMQVFRTAHYAMLAVSGVCVIAGTWLLIRLRHVGGSQMRASRTGG